MERRYSRADFYNGRFYQLGKELFKGLYKDMSNNERVIYAVLKDRFELSITNGWVDENNDIYFYFDQNQLAEECCISLKTVQRGMKVLTEHALIESVRQGVNLPNRLYLLKPELPEYEKGKAANPDKKRTGQNDLSGCDKLTYPDESKSPTNDTEKNDTEYKSSSITPVGNSTAAEEEEEETTIVEYISFDGRTETIMDGNEIDGYIEDKTDVDNDELSTNLCKRVRKILCQICNPFDSGIKQFKVDGRIIALDLDMRKRMYRLISPKLFMELVLAIQNNPEPIKSMKAFILACLYNYDEKYRFRAKTRAAPDGRNHFNDMLQNDYDFEQLEAQLLQLQGGE